MNRLRSEPKTDPSVVISLILAAAVMIVGGVMHAVYKNSQVQTERLIDPRRMKRGAILVNTARGALVNEDFLYEALKSGHLAAAGLDVFAQEPLRADHPLLSLSNVVCAPHLAWLTGETLQRSIAAARDNVERLKDGIALLNRVA